MFQNTRELFRQSSLVKGAFDYQLYAFAASLSLMSSILVGADFENPAQVFDLVVSNLLAFGVLFLILLILERWLSRTRANIGLPTLVVIGAVIGFIKGLVTGLGMYWLGNHVGLGEAIGSRVWQTTLIGMWAVPFLAFLGSLRSRYADQREALIGEKVARGTANLEHGFGLEDFVRLAKTKLRELSLNPEKVDILGEVKRIVDEDLRPLSHKIWLRESQKFPSYRARDLMQVAILKYVYHPHLVVPVWFLTTIVPTLFFHGATDGLSISVARAVFLLVTLSVAMRIGVGSPKAAWIKFAIVIAFITFGQSAIGFFIAGPIELPEDLGSIMSNTIWLTQLTLLSGLGISFFVSDRLVESELEALLRKEKIEQAGWNREYLLRNRQLAQFLHGHLQSQLVTTALRLEQDSQSSVQEKIAIVEQVLEDAIAKFAEQPKAPIQDLLEELEANWAGVVSINYQGEEVDSNLSATLFEVLNEGISNALRHGFASEVHVLTERQGQNLHITLIDNGTGPRNGVPGLGSFYFDSVSLDWALTRGETGSVLRVVLEG